MSRVSKKLQKIEELLESGRGNEDVLKKIVPVKTSKVDDCIYKTAIYIRLSKEDLSDSSSVINQKELLNRFVSEQKDMKLINTYVDNGFTGRNFDRNGFEAMMEHISDGKINCIVVKDLSRFGRDALEVGNYLVNIFPKLKIRFIAINDSYDSLYSSHSHKDLSVFIKNLYNEYYSKELSRKICAVNELKRSRGERFLSHIPYGYKKQNGKMVINEEVSYVVQLIFQMRSQKISYSEIARKLNEENILSPKAYKQICHDKKYSWGAKVIKDITGNFAYVGDTVFYKNNEKLKSSFIPASKMIGIINEYEKIDKEVGREELYYFPQTHEGIINHELFEKVQKINRDTKKEYNVRCNKSSVYERQDNVFLGKIECADCGAKFKRKSKPNKKKNQLIYYYNCGTYINHLKNECSNKYLRENKLKEVVLQNILLQVKIGVHIKDTISRLLKDENFLKEKKYLSSRLKRAEQEVEKYRERKNSTYDDYASNIISLSEYSELKKYYEKKLQEILSLCQNLSQELRDYEKFLCKENKWLQVYERWENQTQLTKEMVDEWIEKIEIYSGKRIHIIFRYKEFYKELLRTVEKAINLT